MASSAGMEALTSKRDLSQVRRDIEAAGYKGDKIVVLRPTSDRSITTIIGYVPCRTLTDANRSNLALAVRLS